MLGETFEDSRMNFIAEKVSHNPVIIAYHADGESWELNATSAGKTKFWGKSRYSWNILSYLRSLTEVLMLR
jgi:oxysterol-binding protein-related protein 3/6/7